jgi:heterogeneous nuclear ribonucleoprotein F/H
MAQSAASDVGAAWNRKPGGGPNSTATKNTNQTGGGGGPGVSSGGNVGGGGVPSYHNNGGYGGRGANNQGGGGRGGYRGNNYRAEGHQGTGGGTRDGPHTGYIRLRGLPFNATTQDILNFFKEYKPLETSAILTYRADGRATGEGYVAFDDVEDAKGAMSLHRRTIGSRYVELFISNKEEYKRNVTRSTTAQS